MRPNQITEGKGKNGSISEGGGKVEGRTRIAEEKIGERRAQKKRTIGKGEDSKGRVARKEKTTS